MISEFLICCAALFSRSSWGALLPGLTHPAVQARQAKLPRGPFYPLHPHRPGAPQLAPLAPGPHRSVFTLPPLAAGVAFRTLKHSLFYMF